MHRFARVVTVTHVQPLGRPPPPRKGFGQAATLCILRLVPQGDAIPFQENEFMVDTPKKAPTPKDSGTAKRRLTDQTPLNNEEEDDGPTTTWTGHVPKDILSD
jgi:hypothetical protein